jgi:hypothetical protein
MAPEADEPRRRPAPASALIAAAVAVVAVGMAIVVILGGGAHRSHRPSTASTSTATTAIATQTPPPAGPPAKPAPTREALGINVNRLFNDRTYTAAQINASISVLQRTGATVARSDALWEAGEPAPPTGGVHHYDWSFDDQIAGSLAAHGLQWLPILDYSAPWTQSIPGQDHSAPRSPLDFAAWAGALAGRYGPGGAFWRAHPRLKALPVDTYEVWNEPDNPTFWVPDPDAPYYANLYLQTRDAITAVDGGARVIVGGLTNPKAFLPAILRARPDLAGHIDGVAIHPYGANPLVVLRTVRDARAVLDSLGLSAVPMYVTEFGWTTKPARALDWAPAQARPGYISATLAALGHTDCGIAAALLYTWVTPQRDPANAQDWFGIEPPDGGGGPDVTAFTTGLAKASAPAPPVKLCAT